MSFSSVSILGCGWLGLPLAERLVRQGVAVRGSTTTPSRISVLDDAGIEPFLLRLDPQVTSDEARLEPFFATDALVLNIPPPRDVDDPMAFHCAQVKSVCAAAAQGGTQHLVMASSTSVYPNVERRVTETDQPPGAPDALDGPRRRSGRTLLAAEEAALSADGLSVSILRLAGLYGGSRQPGRFLAGRTDVSRPRAPVNMIHQDDAIGSIIALLEREEDGLIVNACASTHPTRERFYTAAARGLGLEPPTFDSDDARTGKRVDNQRLLTRVGYVLHHPDVMADVGDA